MSLISFTIPFLPPSLNAYRRFHWREQRRIEREWKDMVAVRWLELGRPTCSEALVTLWFLFQDTRSRDLDNYMATGAKLVGDSLKGRFIPDDSPRHLKGWRFLFEMDRENPGTIVEIEEVGGGLSQRHRDRGEASACACTHADRAGERPKEGIEITRPKCKNYDACSAPLCPLDEQSLRHGLWYPDEEVCTLRDHSGLLWIRNQKRLIKKAGRADRHFTLEMLNRNCIIRRGIEGLDPDAPEGMQLRRWLKAHPERRDLSKEDREKMTQRLAAAKR